MSDNYFSKSELIDKISERTGNSKASVNRVLISLQEIIFDEVKKGNRVRLPGFVAFDPIDRAPRHINNPKTGKLMDIEAKKSVRVRVLDKFKKFLNQ